MKEHVIGFRVDWNEYRKIEEQAEKRGEDVNEWCRNLALAESGKDFGLIASERILLEELAVIRHLLGRLLRHELPPEEFAKLREDVDQNYATFGRKLLEKRSAARSDARSETV